MPDNFKGTVKCLGGVKLLRFRRLFWFDLVRFAEKILIMSVRAPLSTSLSFPCKTGESFENTSLYDLNVKSLERAEPNLGVKTLCTSERRIPAPGVAYSGLLETLTR